MAAAAAAVFAESRHGEAMMAKGPRRYPMPASCAARLSETAGRFDRLFRRSL